MKVMYYYRIGPTALGCLYYLMLTDHTISLKNNRGRFVLPWKAQALNHNIHYKMLGFEQRLGLCLRRDVKYAPIGVKAIKRPMYG